MSTLGDIVGTPEVFSTVGDSMMSVGDIMSTLGDVQYTGVSIQIQLFSIQIELNLYGNPNVPDIPQCTHDIPPHSSCYPPLC